MLALMVQLGTEILVKCPNNPQLLPTRVSAGGGKSAVALCRLQDPPYLTNHPEGCFQCTELSFYPPVSPQRGHLLFPRLLLLLKPPGVACE